MSGVEDVIGIESTKPRKVIENGNVYIIRNGKTYDVLSRETK